AVNAKNRRSPNTQAIGERDIVVDFGGVSARGKGGLEGAAGDPRLLRPGAEATGVEGALVGKDEIVEFPKRLGATQSKNGRRRLGRRSRVAMKRQGIVLPNETNLFRSVHASELVEGATGAAAEGTLEITELDDGHGRKRVAPRRILIAHRHHRSVGLRCRLWSDGCPGHRRGFGLGRRG